MEEREGKGCAIYSASFILLLIIGIVIIFTSCCGYRSLQYGDNIKVYYYGCDDPAVVLRNDIKHGKLYLLINNEWYDVRSYNDIR